MTLLTLIGHRFGRLVVTGPTEAPTNLKYPARYWSYLCDCGNMGRASTGNLRNGSTKSCGCQMIVRGRAAGLRSRTHGESGGQNDKSKQSNEYKSWTSMIQRCTNPNAPNWRLYGARGITVCDRWRLYENFLADMGRRPSLKYSLDRIDNMGHYEPGNCRWATASEQQRNKRPTKLNLLTFNSLSMTRAQWASKLGISKATLCERLQFWSLDDALSKPPQRKLRSGATMQEWNHAQRQSDQDLE